MVLDEGLPRRTDRVQGVALGAGPAGWSLGPADLHHPLATVVQEAGKSSAVAAGTFHRPTATSWHLRPGEGQQAPIARRIGADRRLGQHTANRVGDGGSEAVAVGVDAGTRADNSSPRQPTGA